MNLANISWTSLCHNYTSSLRLLPESLAVAIVNSILAVMATTGNIIILVAIYRMSSSLSSSNTALIGLVVSDLSVGLLVQPLFVIFHVLMSVMNHPAVCQVMMVYNIASSLLAGISVATVTAMSFDRYLCLKLHLRYVELVTKRRMKAVLVSVWIGHGLLTCIWLKSFFFFSIAAAILIGTYVFLTTFSYVKIYFIVKRHKSQIRDQNIAQRARTGQRWAESIKTAVNSFIVATMLSVCYLPYTAALISTHVTEPGRTYWLTLDFTATLVLMNSSLNPFLYCCCNRDIRCAVKKVLLLFVFCKSQN